MGHAKEGLPRVSRFGARHNFTSGRPRRRPWRRWPFPSDSNHVVEGSGKGTDFVVAVNINVLIEVARVAYFARDGDEMSQRFLMTWRIQSDETAGEESQKGSAMVTQV